MKILNIIGGCYKSLEEKYFKSALLNKILFLGVILLGGGDFLQIKYNNTSAW